MFDEVLAIIQQAKIEVHAPQLLLVIAGLSFCLLLRYIRLGLIIAYAYTFHLGWLFCEKDLLSRGDPYDNYAISYLVFGWVLLLLSGIGMFVRRFRE